MGCSDKTIPTQKEEVEDSEKESAKSLEVTHKDALQTTWKDASYNTENNFKKAFFIKGKANLSNYFNYGFTNKKDFFCVEVTPYDGSYSDRWYVYFKHEDDNEEFYNTLLNSNEKLIEVIAAIPENTYDPNQGNMAIGLMASY